LLVVSACASPPVHEPTPAPWIADTSQLPASPRPAPTPAGTPRPVAPPAHPLAAQYHDVAERILTAARADRGAYAKLQYLTDRIGNRISGSPQLDAAIAWAAQALKDDGLTVHTEKVMVPHWVRNTEAAELVTPTARPLRITALGGTVATPKGGITAPVVVVHDFTELEARADAVKGAIVLFDVPMPPWTEEGGSHYGETVKYRTGGASAAARHGAVAALVRSVTARSLRTPHTGSMRYAPDAPEIPTAAVTTEDADLLDRLAAKGGVTVHLRLDAQTLPDAPSANVIGELRGSELPDEVVVIGGHIDSWDVGQGAHDDGAGSVTMMHALAMIHKLGLTPRRTIRVVLFTNEENGVRGGKGYAADHAAELGKTVFALESDSGGFAPRGFWLQAKDVEAMHRARARLADILSLVEPMNVTKLVEGNAGTDVEPMEAGGVVAGELLTDGRTYFDIHHTDADTLDKVDPQALADDAAVVAVVAYIVADMPGRLDSP
jgi:Zn-dependent M28 family amino/carboxypeptidase